MVLAFAEKHGIAPRIYHNAVKNGNEIDCLIPEGANRDTPTMNWFVADDHCVWYGMPLEEKGQSNTSHASNGIANLWPTACRAASSPQPDDDAYEEDIDFNMQASIPQFFDK